jgi:hypothetical protein
VSDAANWLASRAAAAPPALRARISAAMRAAESRVDVGDAVRVSPSLPNLLAEAGLERLRYSLRHPQEADAALDLLAADALLTYACEAAAELGEEALARLQTELSPARFAALLDAPVE